MSPVGMAPIETNGRTRIAEIKIGDTQHIWKLLGPAMYSARPLFPITVRELVQNSHDAQKVKGVNTPVEIEIRQTSDEIVLTCMDKGIGMDEDTILEKFLALGESGKTGKGAATVGGFGVAKASIIGACSSWQLYTNDNYLDSSMIGKQTITKLEQPYDGCKIVLHYSLQEDNPSLQLKWGFVSSAVKLLVSSDCLVNLRIFGAGGNNVEVELKGYKINEKLFAFSVVNEDYEAKIYLTPRVSTKSLQIDAEGDTSYTDNVSVGGDIIYRLNGLTQYTSYGCGDSNLFNAVVEVTSKVEPGHPNYPFAASRERAQAGLIAVVDKKMETYFRNSLTTMQMMENLTGDKATQKIKYYDGDQVESATLANANFTITPLQIKIEKVDVKVEKVIEEIETKMAEMPELEAEFALSKPRAIVNEVITGSFERDGNFVRPEPASEKSPIAFQMCIKYREEKSLKTLSKPKFVKILRVWVELLQKLMESSPTYAHRFAIGFIVDEQRMAERYYDCAKSCNYYLVDPTTIGKLQGLDAILKLLQYATHELTHAKHYSHTENFTSAYHDVFDKFMEKFGTKALRKMVKILK